MLKESLRRISSILCLWLAVVGLVSPLSFSPTTEKVGLKDSNGFITAFADFNADKATDVLVLNTTDGSHSVYLWDSRQYQFRPHPLTLPSGIPSNVRDTHAADFDGDGVVDVLVLSQPTDDCVLATVHWSAVAKGRVRVENSTEIAIVKSLLTILDANGDHLPDLLVTSCQDDGLPKILKSNGEMRSFTETPLYGASSTGPMTYYRASYFVDLNSDCLADIVIDGEIESDDDRSRVLEVWLKQPETGDFEFSGRTLFPPSLNVASNYSRSLAFADMDGDGILEVLGTACRSADKVTVSILYQVQSEPFSGVDVLRCRANDTWKLHWAYVHHVELVGDSPAPHYGGEMSIGDVNLDGYPDILTTAARPGKNGSVQALVLLNARCKSDCNGSKVTLKPRWGLFGDQTNVSRAVFFDLEEDGRLDVLLMQYSTHPMTTGSSGGSYRLLAYKQNFKEDHAFLKVLALSGYCFSHCKSAMEPYGSVLPGAVVSFSTTDRNGDKKRSTATISHGPLQLPFIIFGLGHTPNFIEDLTIGAAHGGPGNKISYHQWSLLVPNSQVIVITIPPTDASRWRLELYLTPSRLVYSTASILGGLFVGIALLVMLLHGKERYQDSRERQQAKHRFHFNAM